jgi:hypothetical protein
VSPEGGFLQRSVFGDAAREKDPKHAGTTSSGMLRGVKEELAGGIASLLLRSMRSRPVLGYQRSSFLLRSSGLRVLCAYVYVTKGVCSSSRAKIRVVHKVWSSSVQPSSE